MSDGYGYGNGYDFECSEEKDEQEPNKKIIHLQFSNERILNKSNDNLINFHKEIQESRDWNNNYQNLLDESFTYQMDHEKFNEITTKLKDLSQEFAEEATKISKIIIEELFWEDKQKRTIQPSSELRGIAGGIKYIKNGIFFKLSMDWKGLYQKDEFANKAAGHELKALNAYSSCRIRGLHFPLLALIRYRGFIVIAQSILPISNDTLVSGSSNGGVNVYSSNSELFTKLKSSASILNLKSHYVHARGNGNKVFLCTASDLEGHLGRDGRFYLIDMARGFPPAYEKGIKSAFLYKLLRPEFVRMNQVPLSPDAYSVFGIDEDQKTHNKEIKEATKMLELSVVQFAKYLDKRLKGSVNVNSGHNSLHFHEHNQFDEELSQLISDMHLRGINVRYLLLLFKNVNEHANKTLILTELVARVVKKHIESKWRELKSSDENDYKKVIIDQFNLVFGNSKESFSHWEKDIKETMEYFQILRIGLSIDSVFDDFSLVRHVAKPKFEDLFERIVQKVGISFNLGKNKLKHFFSNPHPFTIDMVKEISPTVKHVHRTSFEEAVSWSRLGQSKREENVDLAMDLFSKASEKYKEAVSTKSNDWKALYNWILTMISQASLYITKKNITQANQIYQTALEKCKRMVLINKQDYNCYYIYGSTLMEYARVSKVSQREQIYRKACSKLDRAFSLFGEDNETKKFSLIYNCGNAYLHLSNHILKTTKGNDQQIDNLFEIAAQKFEAASKLNPNSSNSFQNYAACLAKRARVTTGEKQEKLYLKSYEIYEKSISLDPNQHEAFFDFGNSLYRFSRVKVQQQQIMEAVVLMFKSASKYLGAVELNPNFSEGYFNIEIVLESIVLSPRNNEQETLLEHIFEKYLKLKEDKVSKNFLEKVSKCSNKKISEMVEHKLQRKSNNIMINSPEENHRGKIELSKSPPITSPRSELNTSIDGDFILSNPPTPEMLRFDKRERAPSINLLKKTLNKDEKKANIFRDFEIHSRFEECVDSLDYLNKLPNAISFKDDSFLYEHSKNGNKYVYKEIDYTLYKKYKSLMHTEPHNPYLVELLHSFVSDEDQNKFILLFQWINGGPLTFCFRLNVFSIETFALYAAQFILAVEYLDNKKLLFNRILQTNHLLVDGDGLLKVLYIDCKYRKDAQLTSEEYCFSCIEIIQSKKLKNLEKYISKTSSHFYSMGVILYQLYFGKPLFREKNVDNILLQKTNMKKKFKEHFTSDKMNVSNEFYTLLEKLLVKYKKTSFKELKSLPFFNKIDWKSLSEGKCDSNLLFVKKAPVTSEVDLLLNKKNKMIQQMQNNPIETLLAPNDFGHTFLYNIIQQQEEN